jgi:hypothetical protein
VESDSSWSSGWVTTSGRIVGSLSHTLGMLRSECVSSVLGSTQPERGVVLVKLNDRSHCPLSFALNFA